MKFEIKNFRIFDKEGSTFDIKPITLLTGANSSGKSSFAKAFLLLEDFLSQYAKTQDLGKCVLNFSSDRFKLGNFATVLNRNSDSNGMIEFNFIRYSNYLHIDVEVSLLFRSNPNDQEGKGHFDSCLIKTSNGTNLFKIWMKDNSDKRGKPYYEVNLPLIRKLYFNRYRDYVEEDKEHGPIMDYGRLKLHDPADIFAARNFTTISKQVYYKTLFLFNIKDLESLDVDRYKHRLGGKSSSVLEDLFKQSGETSFINFYSSLEEKSALHYLGSFPMDGSIFPLVDYAMTGKELVSHPVFDFDEQGNQKGPVHESMHEIRSLVCDEKDPFNFVLGALIKINVDERVAMGYLDSFGIFVDYLNQTIDDLLYPRFVNHLEYIPSDKVSVRRLYDFGDDQDAFHKLLKRYIKDRTAFLTNGLSDTYRPYPKAPSFYPGDIINKWIKRFEIGSSLQIRTFDEGLGLVLRLFSDENDKTGHLLADEGYGISQLISLLLSLEICIMKGYLTHGIITPRFTIVIEEPETHLHPKYQSLLADFFWSALYDYRIRCIVETHSEYLIRKMQVLAAAYAKKESLTDEEMKDKCPIAVYYFPKDKHPYEMEMRSDGKFINEFGSGFFDEAANLAFEIL